MEISGDGAPTPIHQTTTKGKHGDVGLPNGQAIIGEQPKPKPKPYKDPPINSANDWKPPKGSTAIRTQGQHGAVIAWILPNGEHWTVSGNKMDPRTTIDYGPHGAIGWILPGGQKAGFAGPGNIDQVLAGDSKPASQLASDAGDAFRQGEINYINNPPKPGAAPAAKPGAAGAANASVAPGAAAGGTGTSAALSNPQFERLVQSAAQKYNLDPSLIRAIILTEDRSLNPSLPGDGGKSHGLAQIYGPANPGISVAQANDPAFAIDYIAKRMAGFRNAHPDAPNEALLVQHNSPAAAKYLVDHPGDIAGAERLTGTGHYIRDAIGNMGGSSGGGGGYYNAGASGAGGGTAGAGALGAAGGSQADPFSEANFKAAEAQLGFSGALIAADKTGSLRGWLQGIINEKITDPAEWLSRLQQTSWWTSRSDTQRLYDVREQQDRATNNRMIEVQAKALQDKATGLGVPINHARAIALARTTLRNGLSDGEVQQALASEAHYNPNAAYGGTYGDTINTLKRADAAYATGIDDNTLGQWALKVTAGTATLNQYTDFLQQQAVSKYPWLKDQINNGFTLEDISAPFKSEMAKTLEIEPTAIGTNDPTILKALQYQDPANAKAGYTTMPVYTFQDMLRKDPRWAKTNNARDSAMDTAQGVLRDFGLAN